MTLNQSERVQLPRGEDHYGSRCFPLAFRGSLAAVRAFVLRARRAYCYDKKNWQIIAGRIANIVNNDLTD